MKMIQKKLIPLSVGKYINTYYRINQGRAVNKAFSIFCTPRKGKLKPHHEEFLKTANAEDLIFQNEKIRTYHWPGSGETVLLVHGWESNSFRWRDFVKTLQKDDYNIISIDAPAHGASSGKEINVIFYAECLQEVIKKHQPKYLVGHSIGGMTVIFNHFTFKNSEVKKIVALGAPSEMEEMMKGYKSLLRLKNPVMQQLEAFFKSEFGFSFADFSAARFAEDFDVPGLLIHDKQDKIVPLKASEAINKNWKNSELIVTEGLGHSLKSEKVNEAILNFFQN